MLTEVLGFIMSVLTYIVVQMDDMYIAPNVSLLTVIMVVMVIITCIWITGGLLRHNGNS